MVRVILRHDIENLGETGEVVDVKAGYARNYLVPHGLALEATEGNMRRLREERRHRDKVVELAVTQAREAAEELEGRSVTFTVRAGEDGRLFGSVTGADVAEALAEDGVEVDRRAILLEEPIKQLGVYRVPIHLPGGLQPEIKVWVVAQE
ncbi:MAG: 50S ribosomal protein L9 [Gemmatimonadota bacterium]